MPRAKRVETPEPAPMGNLSPADLEAIHGAAADESGDQLGGGPIEGAAPRQAASDEEVSIGARLLSHETRIGDLEKALEIWAQNFSQGQIPTATAASLDMPTISRPATPAEERAYARTNLALHQERKAGFNGLQAWRNADSPVMEPADEKAA